ncbi:MAG: hypothetical protein PHN39_04090 [Candidatus Pacebacteria bacterium]|nr:hypothetical protein [Candidatus Paceibacterota bacterium]
MNTERFIAIAILIFVIRPIIQAIYKYFRNKPGSKLGEEKKIYNYIGYGIYITLGIAAIALILYIIISGNHS